MAAYILKDYHVYLLLIINLIHLMFQQELVTHLMVGMVVLEALALSTLMN